MSTHKLFVITDEMLDRMKAAAIDPNIPNERRCDAMLQIACQANGGDLFNLFEFDPSMISRGYVSLPWILSFLETTNPGDEKIGDVLVVGDITAFCFSETEFIRIISSSSDPNVYEWQIGTIRAMMRQENAFRGWGDWDIIGVV